MAAGRPSSGGRRRGTPLAPLAALVDAGIRATGHASTNSFVVAHPQLKNPVYELLREQNLPSLSKLREIQTALRLDPRRTEECWDVARAALRRREEQAGGAAAQPNGWVGRPLDLPPGLTSLLEAQFRTLDGLPSRLDRSDAPGREPSASETYVPRCARSTAFGPERTGPDEGDDPGHPTAAVPVDDRPVPAGATLDRHRHLLLTGAPGIGKSMFGFDLVRRLSGIWLDVVDVTGVPTQEPLFPLLVPATAVTEQRSWSTVLAGAALRTYGQALRSAPDPGLFEDRVLGVRWLLVIDGLDEIRDPELRRRTARTVAGQGRQAHRPARPRPAPTRAR